MAAAASAPAQQAAAEGGTTSVPAYVNAAFLQQFTALVDPAFSLDPSATAAMKEFANRYVHESMELAKKLAAERSAREAAAQPEGASDAVVVTAHDVAVSLEALWDFVPSGQ